METIIIINQRGTLRFAYVFRNIGWGGGGWNIMQMVVKKNNTVFFTSICIINYYYYRKTAFSCFIVGVML